VLSAQFPTQAGRRYLLKMSLGVHEIKKEGQPLLEQESGGPLAVRVVAGFADGARLDVQGFYIGSGTHWVDRSMLFVAKGPLTTVEIRGWIPPDLYMNGALKHASNSLFLGVDNVSVRQLWPPPLLWPWSGKRLWDG